MNNIQEGAIRDIELLADKMRQIHISLGTHAGDGYRFKYDSAIAWDGVTDAPQEIIDLSEYMDSTNLEAKEYIIGRMAEMKELFRVSDKLKYAAKKEVTALPDSCTVGDVSTVYNKHLAIFEQAMYANV